MYNIETFPQFEGFVNSVNKQKQLSRAVMIDSQTSKKKMVKIGTFKLELSVFLFSHRPLSKEIKTNLSTETTML